MSGTTATISILNKDNTVDTIRVMYDGSLPYTGKILQNIYNKLSSVVNLIESGYVSSLYKGENLQNHPCVRFSDKKSYLNEYKYEFYNYLFKAEDETWYLVKKNRFIPLSEALDKAYKKIDKIMNKTKNIYF